MLVDEPTVTVPVETLRPGDEVLVHPKVGFHLVAAVEQHDDRFVVAYYHHQLENYGLRRNQRRITEKQLVPMHAGELVEARRGAAVLAEVMRREMREQEHHRWATLANKTSGG